MTKGIGEMQNKEKINEEKLEALMEAGVFDIISGKVEINVNNGQIQSIHIYKVTYKRKKSD